MTQQPKLPYIECNGVIVTDSDFCIKHLVKEGVSNDLDVNLTPEQKVDGRAWQAYLEEKIYPCVVKQRWLDEPNYTNIVNTMLRSVVWPVRSVVGWNLSRKIYHALWAQGTARHSDEEIESLMQDAVSDMVVKSQGKRYFHGTETFTTTDIVVYSFLSSGLLTTFDINWNRLVLSQITLVKYCLHMTESLFPEYEPLLKKLRETESNLEFTSPKL
ncbi:glutathione S-transferase [Planoprotostelium fungivorum]|uniref:Glutathione S-transferase n=1 Tax=Planoprotostelium fungivorum TaxID=1890364 RepID=A0A2P6NFL1_9EUKA|nr:glutathione S-transferase [Planoprotostelium fungivorum]